MLDSAFVLIHIVTNDPKHQSIIKVTLIEDQRDVREGLAVLINGSPGFRCTATFRLKNTLPARFLESLKEVASGGLRCLPKSRGALSLSSESSGRLIAHPLKLTPQETELLKLIVEGHSYKTAAAKLQISTSTVSFHLQNIYNKLQVHSKSEAVAKAIRNKLV